MESTLKLKWLKEHMLTLLAEPTPQQLAGHCRAYILGLIGGVLMPDKSSNTVHPMYLPLFVDLDQVGWCSLGLGCLTHLYREMCRVIYPTSKKYGDVHYFYSLGHGIAYHSFNQGSSTSCHIHLLIGKQKIFTQTKSIFQ